MTKIQYMGASDSRVINAGDTINGAVSGGIPVAITWNQANNFVIDTTQAPYTGITAPMASAILALGHGEFVDVTNTPQTPTHQTLYGTGSTPASSASSHQVSTGAAVSIAAGAGATSAGVGALGANDTAGTFTATSLATGNTADEVLLTVTFAQAYASTPKDIQIQETNAAAKGCQLYPVNVSKTGFSIAAHTAPGASAVLTGSYSVTG
jgi:hypothetical protein